MFSCWHCDGLRWVAICSFEPLRDCYHAQCDGAPAKVVQRVQASKEKKKRKKERKKENMKERKEKQSEKPYVMKWHERPELASL